MVINLGWYIGLWAIVVAFIARPASWWGTALLVVVHSVCLYSSPASILVAPIWLIRLVRGGLRRDKKEIGLSLTILGTIASLVLLTGDLGSAKIPTTAHFSSEAMFNYLTTRVFSEAIVGTHGTEYLRNLAGSQVVVWITGLALVGLITVSWFTKFKNALLALTFLGILLVYIVFTLVGRLNLNPMGENLQNLFLINGGRYFFIGNALIYLICLLTLDRLRPTRFKTELIMAVLAGMVWVVSQTFGLTPFQDLNWPKYAKQIPGILGKNDKPSLIIPINPPGFGILFNFDQVNAENIPPENYLPELQEGNTYAQTFIGSCNGLSSVSLYMSTYKRAMHGPVVLELYDNTSHAVITRQSLPANSIKDDTWQQIYFPPVPDSQNHIYRLSVSSPGTPVGNGVTVYVSKSDKYPAGDAFLNDVKTQGDLVFHYTCRVPIPLP